MFRPKFFRGGLAVAVLAGLACLADASAQEPLASPALIETPPELSTGAGDGTTSSRPEADLLAPRPDDPFPASTGPAGRLGLPSLQEYAPRRQGRSLATGEFGTVTLAAKLTDDGEEIGSGLVWRVFGPEPGADGKLPLIASARGGTTLFQLAPGPYLVHASFGRAGATMRISVTREPRHDVMVLDAGGLELDAVIPGGSIDPQKLSFAIYEGEETNGDRALIIPDVKPGTVVRLKAGVYHVVSTYGHDNAVVRSDIRVDAGKLTQATVEHHAASLTFRLVRESGGDAMADTSWSVLTDSGDEVREGVGAYFSAVLAEGDYTVVAKNRERIYHRDVTVTAGKDEQVDVLAVESDTGDRESLD